MGDPRSPPRRQLRGRLSLSLRRACWALREHQTDRDGWGSQGRTIALLDRRARVRPCRAYGAFQRN
jgi:hypothetical protein